MLHRPYYTERTQNVQKRSKTVSEPGTFQFQIETFLNVFKCCSRFPDTFENVQKPKTFTPAIYRKASGNLEPFRTFERPQISGSKNPFFFADLDCCFFHFRGVDSRFVDLVPRTYNTFFLVLKCAEKTLKNYPSFIDSWEENNSWVILFLGDICYWI